MGKPSLETIIALAHSALYCYTLFLNKILRMRIGEHRPQPPRFDKEDSNVLVSDTETIKATTDTTLGCCYISHTVPPAISRAISKESVPVEPPKNNIYFSPHRTLSMSKSYYLHCLAVQDLLLGWTNILVQMVTFLKTP